MALNTNLNAFATAVGNDIKELKAKDATLTTRVESAVQKATEAETTANGLRNQLNNKIEQTQMAEYVSSQIATKADKTAVTQEISEAKTALKNEILGLNVPETFDTLKEIADYLQNNEGTMGEAITSKLSDHSSRIQALENWKTTADGIDMLATYNTAKGSVQA